MNTGLGFRGFLVISLLLLLFSVFVSRVRAQDRVEQLQTLSQQIQKSLQDSKQSQQVLMTQLAEAIDDSSKSKEQVKGLEHRLTLLSSSLESTHDLLTSYAGKISILETKLKASGKRVFGLTIICLVFLLLKVIRIALGIMPQTAAIVNTFAATKVGKYIDIVI